ncbi:ABC transporter related protein [Coriobacterium glomerans PW2]|uniref:ABC transporter related protein n=1 Tax=Coriobacterium glomerans (strain ATCC 49209 / DSM 20642 / JCM 10262 / PW2) TaxID=700015 RepID=F2N9W2_CORGP|nr:ABC transporter ATP-binding protein [Coriobacterium glomerans]AEB06217.1 ABC transporter related protein [Coriobacterium glomerans PW2]
MLKLLRCFAGSYRRFMILGPATKLLEAIFDLLTPLVIARMIDEGVGEGDLGSIWGYGLALFAMATVGLAFTLVCQKMASRASQGIGTDIRHSLYRRVNEFSYAELDRFGTPSLITRITNDVNQVQLAIALGIRQLVRWPFLAIGSMVAALLIDVRLGLVFLVSTPLIGVIFWVVMARCVPYFKSMQRKLDRIGLITREGISGIRVIRAFVREDHERERFHDASFDQASTAIAVGRLSSFLNPVTFFIMYLAICAILWQGGIQVNVGSLTQGEVMAFVNYMMQTLLSIVYVANLVVVFTKAGASASRINEVLACEPSITDAGGEPVESSSSSSVAALRMRGATFAYPGSTVNSIDDVTLELFPGQTLGVIGGTGSGKSTLISLIPRLYDVRAGSVEVLGEDVRHWPLARLRRAIGLVPQSASLVSGTIASNLRWRDESASDDELWRALDIAQAGEFVRDLEDGLNSTVEAGGRNFSGGQRQRLTIARALVGSPRLLILDDAASALDFKTDAALRRAILTMSRQEQMTSSAIPPLACVIVSQRVSAVRDSDVICVLDHGRVSALGTHEELLRTSRLYREIGLSQLRPDELGEAAEATSEQSNAAEPTSGAIDEPSAASAPPASKT